MKFKNLSSGSIYLIISASVALIAVGGVVYYSQNIKPVNVVNIPSVNSPIVNSPIVNSPIVNSPVACTMEAKLCPDGSYVGRTGPNCEFSPCQNSNPTPGPISTSNCTSDADCPSANYSCQVTQGYGTVSPDGGPSTTVVVAGECKLKAGNKCGSNNDCLSGLVCHAGLCTELVSSLCSGPNDASCSSGYQCIQDCGAPVSRVGDPSPAYHCVVDEIASQPRNCPICLASNVLIDTPSGEVPVTQISKGMKVWSVDENGQKIASKVVETSKVLVPSSHKVVHLILIDGREIWLSAPHPLVNGSTAGKLKVGDSYDGSFVDIWELIPYWDNYTYDILPDSQNGNYWANGILVGSSLLKK